MKVLVGLSGGVDSAVAAHILKSQGHDVICAFMRNWDSFANNDILGNPTIKDDMCSQEVDYDDAKRVADHLGLELLRVDYVKEYWDHVFSFFLAETERGNTPNPDILCNRFVKFDAFYDFMDANGFEALATGHYAITRDGKMYRAVDQNKDQTYFLSRVRPEVLPRVLFPLGSLTKDEVRRIALELDLPVATKKDSTGICFIGERQYRDFLKNYLKDVEGDIIDVDTQKVLGKHQGVMFYTIGQRHGLDISTAVGPWFVVGKDLSTNRIYVGKGADHPMLFAGAAEIAEINWFADEKADLECTAKFRYRQKDIKVRISWLDETRLRVEMIDDVKSVTLGQEAVFYLGEACLGGGRIDRVFDTNGNEVTYDSKL
ncbi:tRNA 2-thiouridine(34) synthase MnmA [Erysipelothrix rhusiopathiae]|nr:tRNA 2-thiouridine(34) synthase MnmA [Erysipelothrix rhusiopathiae]MDE8125391.1 tRNA 2-thiouridine(34) synthase MnmA [Erysipelothrix rhusiopathiae]MDE8128633.1 tRNA 2-thiouridine(34) synthase MnmA [Erysipelothrix rhusiopathiae]MDE8150224.1 tRNA 2-thiouridine(34) synthase MnmA [Erysipelothrix rhusiopathiae]MDE8153469.1 tRNA 2-thiouridine(34) synthase MnmA [Erysipelothrix rhusiopathiae]